MNKFYSAKVDVNIEFSQVRISSTHPNPDQDFENWTNRDVLALPDAIFIGVNNNNNDDSLQILFISETIISLGRSEKPVMPDNYELIHSQLLLLSDKKLAYGAIFSTEILRIGCNQIMVRIYGDPDDNLRDSLLINIEKS